MKTLFKELLFTLCVITSINGLPAVVNARPVSVHPDAAEIGTRLHSLAIPFVENLGQTHPDVRFYAQTFGGTLFVTGDGRMVYSLPVNSGANAGSLVFREQLIDGARKPIAGEQKSPTRVNVFKGENPDLWRTEIPTYALLSLGEVYEGITLKLKARGRNIEKLFFVRPGADPGLIRLGLDGVEFVTVNGSGELVLTTPKLGNVTFTKPVAFQFVDGQKQPVDVAYHVSGKTYGFKVGAYDRGKELIIDPLLSTYLGGSNKENARAVETQVVNGKLYFYVAGNTTSNDFPGIAMYQSSQGYNQDAFIALLDMNFTAAQFTYLGGSGEDIIYDMVIRKPNNAVYVVGTTDGHFPVSWAGTRGGGKDAFIARLSPDLGTLEKSRYFGGSNADFGMGIALYYDESADPDDWAVYITGQTNSNDLPVSYDPNHPGDLIHTSAQTKLNTTGVTDLSGSLHDGFAAKFTLDLGLRRVTYIGGRSDDSAYGIAIHPLPPHDVYVVGTTAYDYQAEPYGTKGCFPWTAGGGIPTFVGSQDAFVVRLNANLTADPAPQASYYGGTGLDMGTALAIHPGTGDVYIVGGRTNEPVPPSTIPTDQYAFVAYFNRELTEYKGDAHIGETAKKQVDRAQDIKIVNGVGVYVLGYTRSSDLTGTAGSILPAYRGGYSDLFVARFHNNLDRDKVTYVGGSNQEEVFGKGLAVAEDPAAPGNWHVFVAGDSYGSGLAGVTDATAFQPEFKGGADLLITRMNADLRPDATPDIEVQPRTVDFGNVVLNTNSATKTVTVENIGGTPLTISSISIAGPASGDFTINPAAGATPCGAGFPLDIAGSSSCTVSLVFRTSVLNQWREADLVIRTANDPDEPTVRVHLIGYSGPEITATSSVKFPTTQIGSSTQKTFQIKNDGVANLTVSSIQKTGIAFRTGEDFALLYGEVTTTCPDPGSGPFTLQPGRSCNITVAFSPTAPPGPQEAMVFIFSDDLDENPAFVDLTGEGVTELRTDIWSHDLEFRDTPVGNSRNLPWLITNTGSVALSITDVSLSDTTNFTIDPNGGALPCGPPPFSLAKVTSCTMTVTFKPQTPGAFNQTIGIGSNDPDENPLVVHMTGNGVGDTDGDGVPDAEESGDENHDGVPDAQQPHVAALQLPDRAQKVVIEAKTAGTTITQAQVLPVHPADSDLPASLAGSDFPFGLYQFTINLPPGVDTAVVTITLPPGETADTYIKYGPEADNLEPHYYDFGNQARYPGCVTIAGNVITLRLTDNGAGDHDGLHNGVIVEPGAPMRWMKGDLDRNGRVDLGDAVLSMRILTRSKIAVTVRKQADVNADGKIGLPDVIYILQKISGLR